MPERFAPGHFDVFMSSHQVRKRTGGRGGGGGVTRGRSRVLQLFHVFVVSAAYVHYVMTVHQYEWRRANSCSA